MRKEGLVLGLATTAAVGVGLLVYLKKQNSNVDYNSFENYIEEEDFVEKNTTFIQDLIDIFKQTAIEILERLVNYVKNLISELIFKTKMTAHEKKVDWGL